MDDGRRKRIRELIQTLEAANEQVRAILKEEEDAFDDRSPPSKETRSGYISEDAMRNLEEATTEIGNAIDNMQYAVGDASPPELPNTAFIKRRL
jgi:ribosome recycling factor